MLVCHNTNYERGYRFVGLTRSLHVPSEVPASDLLQVAMILRIASRQLFQGRPSSLSCSSSVQLLTCPLVRAVPTLSALAGDEARPSAKRAIGVMLGVLTKGKGFGPPDLDGALCKRLWPIVYRKRACLRILSRVRWWSQVWPSWSREIGSSHVVYCQILERNQQKFANFWENSQRMSPSRTP